MKAYQTLCTEFYDLTKPEAGVQEAAFYQKLLKGKRGPFLEAMCGSGRLLIPLLKAGFAIDGVDNSSSMLESCRRRCKSQGLAVKLYDQSLQHLSLPQKYEVIFTAGCSFQLIHDRAQALDILKNLRYHLLPGGKLVIDTFVPWKEIQENIHNSILANRSTPATFEQTISSSQDCQIILYSTVTFDFKEQLEVSQVVYEKWDHGQLVCREEEEYAVRWYYRYEMQLLLEKAGFSSIIIQDETFEKNPQAIVYIAEV